MDVEKRKIEGLLGGGKKRMLESSKGFAVVRRVLVMRIFRAMQMCISCSILCNLLVAHGARHFCLLHGILQVLMDEL